MQNDVTTRKLERQLMAQIKADHEECLRLGYHPTRFMGMVYRLGPVEAYRRLIVSQRPSEGFLRLFEMNPPRLDLSVEARAFHGPWRVLFGEHILTLAKKRLVAFGCPNLARVR